MHSYVSRLRSVLDEIDTEAMRDVVALLEIARRVYVCGNGGSDANAAHLQLHLQEEGLEAHDLMADTALLTAYANDGSYDDVLRERLRQMASPDDCLVVISGSGRSRNIILALAAARAIGMSTIGLLGSGGGDARWLCNKAIIFKTKEYGPIEDGHSAVVHIIKGQLAEAVASSGGVREPGPLPFDGQDDGGDEDSGAWDASLDSREGA